MPRFDAQIEVLCDDCGEVKYWWPEYVYHDYSGKSGHYDTSDYAFSKWCIQNKWAEVEDQTFCELCTPPETEVTE